MHESLSSGLGYSLKLNGFCLSLFNACKMNYKEVNSDELEEIISSGDNKEIVLLDVRTPQEYNNGHIPGTVLIDFYNPQFKEQVNELDKNKSYYVICRSGNRSGKACSIMYDLGFKDLNNLEGGMLQWMGDVE